ncbi:hypothetical protein VOLCADRAFT_89214 [Volvox carteri f. nagariensis]|uniref:ATP-grasp domain-containing protein n=1 Tax=Volvox carteri f. nagariensis TaxID=3068 RepID=D8TR38_VOLCA|nr:uncharacterized protein VOLCADRAFT_89214 [Volvox carteri f. nagariensis]EFJ50268.1 hypothetical protein VOLCADRAFT_89214 [Volvox carteri f. nagariensis]|eukprot:XP_002948888.1 hypothetical protein VOLCADRAFT_89214 [Volvox carteri f. nagariensis]
MKKSALSAALAGGASAPAPVAPAQNKGTFLDPAAFPCIEYADVIDGVKTADELGATAEQLGNLDIADVAIVGSAPTNVLLNGVPLADYPLNPRRRRAGEETTPDVAASLEMNVDAVNSRTRDGRSLRRQVLKGAVMVFVTAGYSGKRFIFEKAKELGLRTVVLDGPDSWVRLLEKDGIIEKFVPIDFTDVDTVFDRCLQAIKDVRSTIGELDGITTFCEMAVPLASRLAEKLGLPCNTPEAVDNARDKHATREIMARAGLPTPKHYKVVSEADVAKAAAHVGFPAVIKPISGAASIGVIRANNEEDLLKAFRKVQHDMSRARIVAGALVEGDDEGSDAAGNAGGWIHLELMVEEYLDGHEVDCDLIFDNGRPVYGAITDNWPTVEPYFNETGSNCPSVLPKAHQIELLELSVRAVQSLGFKLGVFHVECKYTSRGARLIEVNCRMGGGPVRDTNLLVWGVDLVEEHLMACAGIPVRPPVARRPLKQMAEYTINAQKTGHLKSVDFLDRYKGQEGVLYARPLVQPGAKCNCVADGLPTWLCELMVIRPDVRQAIAVIKKMEQEINDELETLIV